MADLKIHNLKKGFDGNEIIKGIDSDIRDREFVVFVGPSGCGKSTLLRLIAGLEEVSSGRIELDGRATSPMSARPATRHGVPDLCPYPHMTVRKNMSFALDGRCRQTGGCPQDRSGRAHPGAGAAARTQAAATVRRPAPARRHRRAIVRNPKVFLFDEPLSNLDAALRVQMRWSFRACTGNCRPR